MSSFNEAWRQETKARLKENAEVAFKFLRSKRWDEDQCEAMDEWAKACRIYREFCEDCCRVAAPSK